MVTDSSNLYEAEVRTSRARDFITNVLGSPQLTLQLIVEDSYTDVTDGCVSISVDAVSHTVAGAGEAHKKLSDVNK